jgi:hypothetical protein
VRSLQRCREDLQPGATEEPTRKGAAASMTEASKPWTGLSAGWVLAQNSPSLVEASPPWTCQWLRPCRAPPRARRGRSRRCRFGLPRDGRPAVWVAGWRATPSRSEASAVEAPNGRSPASKSAPAAWGWSCAESRPSLAPERHRQCLRGVMGSQASRWPRTPSRRPVTRSARAPTPEDERQKEGSWVSRARRGANRRDQGPAPARRCPLLPLASRRLGRGSEASSPRGPRARCGSIPEGPRPPAARASPPASLAARSPRGTPHPRARARSRRDRVPLPRRPRRALPCGLAPEASPSREGHGRSRGRDRDAGARGPGRAGRPSPEAAPASRRRADPHPGRAHDPRGLRNGRSAPRGPFPGGRTESSLSQGRASRGSARPAPRVSVPAYASDEPDDGLTCVERAGCRSGQSVQFSIVRFGTGRKCRMLRVTSVAR